MCQASLSGQQDRYCPRDRHTTINMKSKITFKVFFDFKSISRLVDKNIYIYLEFIKMYYSLVTMCPHVLLVVSIILVSIFSIILGNDEALL